MNMYLMPKGCLCICTHVDFFVCLFAFQDRVFLCVASPGFLATQSVDQSGLKTQIQLPLPSTGIKGMYHYHLAHLDF